MPCCTFDRRPDSFPPAGVFAVCGALVLLLAPATALVRAAGLLVRPLRAPGRRLQAILSATAGVVASDFLHPRYRCTLSARLLDRSPRLAGLVYRHLNLAVLLLLWGALLGAACWLGALW